MANEDALLLGLDIGTTNLKAVVFDIRGRALASASVPTPTHYPQPGWAYYEAEEIWRHVLDLVRNALSKLEPQDVQRIASVACASMGEAGVLIDPNGHACFPVIAWFDQRTEPQAEFLARAVGEERIFSSSGLSIYPIYSLCKILWIREHHPEVFTEACTWLNMADFIAYRLCGVAATDYSLASRTLALNIHQRCWDEALIRELGLDPRLFAPLSPSGAALGTLLPEVAEATGLPKRTLVATGGQDHVCAALALGVIQPTAVLDSMGTAEALFLPLAAPINDPRLAQKGYAQGIHVAGGHYILGGQFASGASVEWFRNTIGEGANYRKLIEESSQVPAGSNGTLFIPHLRTANTPHNDPLAMGAFLGLTTDTQRSTLFRAVLEGLALEMRAVLEPLIASHQQELERILATGGGTRNDLLMQIKADVFGKTIEVVEVEEGAALGAAMLAGAAAGVYADLGEAVRIVTSAHRVRYISPTSSAAFYDRLYTEAYRHAYEALRPINHALRRLVARC